MRRSYCNSVTAHYFQRQQLRAATQRGSVSSMMADLVNQNNEAKQKDKTKGYWDTFYSTLPSTDNANQFATKGNLLEKQANNSVNKASDLEWIVSNSSQLLDTILSLFPLYNASDTGGNDRDTTSVHVLEIGCGVSQLSLSLLQRILLKRKEAIPPFDERAYDFVATDVSSVCIENNQMRDDAFISSLHTKDGSLGYKFLDVLNGNSSSPLIQKYDIILDKGTLDTFLFRSKRTRKTVHPPLLTLLLNNIHRWLRSGCGAKYIIISPRSKIKSVRDFRGFVSVRRITVDAAMLDGDIVLVKGNNKKAAPSKSEVYLYECIKNDSYNPEVDSPYSNLGHNTEDKSSCKCGMSFKDFRGMVDVRDQGEVTWARRWKNHSVHCKGDL